MAHRGRSYRLNNRRDTCLGCTNHLASFPRNREVNLHVVSPDGVSIVIGPMFIVLYQYNDKWDKWPKFRSDPFTAGGHTFHCVVDCIGFNYVTQRMPHSLGLRVGSLGVLGKNFEGTSGRCHTYGGPAASWASGFTWNNSFWGGIPSVLRFEASALSYARESLYTPPPGGWGA